MRRESVSLPLTVEWSLHSHTWLGKKWSFMLPKVAVAAIPQAKTMSKQWYIHTHSFKVFGKVALQLSASERPESVPSSPYWCIYIVGTLFEGFGVKLRREAVRYETAFLSQILAAFSVCVTVHVHSYAPIWLSAPYKVIFLRGTREIMGGHVHRRIVSVTVIIVVLLVWWRWTRPNVQGQGYVLTLEYTGQLVAGVRGLQSQQCWISSFGLPLAIVEPFLSNSTLRLDSNRDPWSQEAKNSMKFRDIFDLNHFNANSDALGLPVLVSWDHFHTFAPRSVIVVTVESAFSHGCLHFNEKTCTLDTVDENSFAPCNSPTETERVIISLQKHNFAVVRSVCLSCFDDTLKGSPSAITKHILGPYNPDDVTILINKWKFSFVLTSDCKEKCIKLQPESYIESPRVHKDTRKYIQKYFPTENFVAVTLRIEWFLISNREGKKNRSSALECLSEVMAAVGEYQSEIGGSKNNHPFLAMDIGAYGSNTFKDTLRHIKTSESFYNETVSLTKNFVKDLYEGMWTFKDWEKSFATIPGVVGERAYIGTLQRSIASRGDCVIFMGGGHFQHMILEAYLKLHPDRSTQCIKLVCMAPPFFRLFSRIIASQ